MEVAIPGLSDDVGGAWGGLALALGKRQGLFPGARIVALHQRDCRLQGIPLATSYTEPQSLVAVAILFLLNLNIF